MLPVWRSPIFLAGVLLLVLGIGNWSVSRSKINEFVERARTTAPPQSITPLEEYPELTHRTNAALLARLHRGSGEYSFLDAKIDFYEIVESGGRVLALIGLLLITAAFRPPWRHPPFDSSPQPGHVEQST